MLATLYWQYSQALPWVLGLLVTTTLVLVWLYMPMTRQRPLTARLLPVFRCAAVSALLVSLLRPVMTRLPTDPERGPVLIVIDASRSMGVTDTSRPAGQWVAVAAAMGRLPTGRRDTDALALQQSCDHLAVQADEVERARAGFDYAKLAGQPLDSAAARLDQAVSEMQATARTASGLIKKFPRRQGLQRSLAFLVSGSAGVEKEAWLDKLHDRARAAAADAEQTRVASDAELYAKDPQVRQACQPLQSLSRLQLAELVTADPGGGLMSRLGSDIPVMIFAAGRHVSKMSTAADSIAAINADGNSTDSAGAIRSALKSLGSSPVRAVVLLSDGRQVNTQASGPMTAAVPVFTVAVAARSGIQDCGIVQAIVPNAAYLDDHFTLSLQYRGVGLNGISTMASVADQAQEQQRRVTMTDDRQATLDFQWTAQQPGARRLVFSLAPVPGEISVENNQVQRWIKVIARRCRVAVVGGGDPREVDTIRGSLSHQSWLDLLPADAALTPQQLGTCDALVWCAGDAHRFNLAQWNAVDALVNIRGGALVMMPGDGGDFPSAREFPQLAELLPFARGAGTGWRTLLGRSASFRLVPAPAVVAAELLINSGEGSDIAWEMLPPVARFVPIAPLKPNAKPLLIEEDSQVPVLTEMRSGRGKVFCLSTRETWRWRGSSGAIDAAKFWQRLIRRGYGEPYEADENGIYLDSDQIAVSPGTPVRLRAKYTRAGADPASAQVTVLAGDKTVRELNLAAADPRGGGRFEGTLNNLQVGDYQLCIRAGETSGPRIPLHVQDSAEDEMEDLSGDEGWLRRLADQSNGQAYRLDQVDELAPRIRSLSADTAPSVEATLWDSPYLYAFLVGCLLVEWSLRKTAGLL